MNNSQKSARIQKLELRRKEINAELKTLKMSLMRSCKPNKDHKFGSFIVRLSEYDSKRIDSARMKSEVPGQYEKFSKTVKTQNIIIRKAK